MATLQNMFHKEVFYLNEHFFTHFTSFHNRIKIFNCTEIK